MLQSETLHAAHVLKMFVLALRVSSSLVSCTAITGCNQDPNSSSKRIFPTNRLIVRREANSEGKAACHWLTSPPTQALSAREVLPRDIIDAAVIDEWAELNVSCGFGAVHARRKEYAR
ncbi:hypothetical protein C0Q70_16325 [Pomacea canaliculata]|uniref:Secreted protein n=1 Tax=Pomacea canaliculata TaxID=400727 RepID=A0A2T7NPI6_POMCA|nr:hypothetical protein C0Q70_16325 [Pomacea canaliculata]